MPLGAERGFHVAENFVKWGGQREMTFKPKPGG